MATFTQIGTVIGVPASMQLADHTTNGALSTAFTLSDDASYSVDQLDFNFPFYGVNYSKSTTFINTNSSLNFGAGSSKNGYGGITHADQKGIWLFTSDKMPTYIVEKSIIPGVSWTIRYEAGEYGAGGTTTIWEITLFVDGVIQLVTGTMSFTGGYNFVTNGSDTGALDFTPTQQNSYVFKPTADFSGYTLATGSSYVVSGNKWQDLGKTFLSGTTPQWKGSTFQMLTSNKKLDRISTYQSTTSASGLQWQLWTTDAQANTLTSLITSGTATAETRKNWYTQVLGTNVILQMGQIYCLMFKHDGNGYQYVNYTTDGWNVTDFNAQWGGLDTAGTPSVGLPIQGNPGPYRTEIVLATVNVTNVNLNDTVTASDSAITRIYRVYKTMTDTVTSSETFRKLAAYTKTDSIAASETFTKQPKRNISDSMTITDANISITKGKFILITDSVSLSDTIKKAIAAVKTDSISLSDNQNKQPRKSLSDSVTSTDNNVSKAKSGYLNDGINITDATIRKAIQRLKTDLVSLSDTLFAAKQLSIRLYDVVTSSEIFKIKGKDVIGVIEIDGEKQLYVYLNGEKQLYLNLDGEQIVFVNLDANLKGGGNMTAMNQDFSMFAGDSKTLYMTIYGDNNVNIMGSTITWTLMNERSNVILTKSTADGGISIIDGTHFQVSLIKADTQYLNGTYQHRGVLTDVSGNQSTLLMGTVEIET